MYLTFQIRKGTQTWAIVKGRSRPKGFQYLIGSLETVKWDRFIVGNYQFSMLNATINHSIMKSH